MERIEEHDVIISEKSKKQIHLYHVSQLMASMALISIGVLLVVMPAAFYYSSVELGAVGMGLLFITGALWAPKMYYNATYRYPDEK